MKIENIQLVIKSMANERGVNEDVILEAIEIALATVAAKRYKEEAALRVAIDKKTGEYETFRTWTIVEDEEKIENPAQEISLKKAHEVDPDLTVGDLIEEKVESAAFGRIAAQQARQVIMQKVREAERSKELKQYQRRVGEMVIGIVKRVTRDYIILDLGDNAEGLLLREEMIPREAFRINDRVRAYLAAAKEEKRGPQLLLSRTCPQMLTELFKIEVPEISEEVIEIKAVARDPGSRAKIAVKTNDGRIDPIGACVGMRGSRVQAVSNELGGERIDIVLWDDNPAQLVINAMAPAEVASIVVDEESHTMDIAVAEENLSQAIGRNGQNVRLASELTGWTLNVMTVAAAASKQETEVQEHKQLLMNKLDVDEDVAEMLVNEGFASLEEIAYVPAKELLVLGVFEEDVVAELQRRASDVLLTQEIASEEKRQPSKDLLEVPGMTDLLASQCVNVGILTRDDLADQSVDELVDMMGIDEELAAKLIMSARAPWFEKEGR